MIQHTYVVFNNTQAGVDYMFRSRLLLLLTLSIGVFPLGVRGLRYPSESSPEYTLNVTPFSGAT